MEVIGESGPPLCHREVPVSDGLGENWFDPDNVAVAPERKDFSFHSVVGLLESAWRMGAVEKQSDRFP